MSEVHRAWEGNCHLALPPVTSYYSPLGLAQHETRYFWAKLKEGVLKIKEQHPCPWRPSRNSFLFPPQVIAPGIAPIAFLKGFSVTGLTLHYFRSLVSLFFFCYLFFSITFHWMSEPKETLSQQVQLTCLPGGKPRCRNVSLSCWTAQKGRGQALSTAPLQGRAWPRSWRLPPLDLSHFPFSTIHEFSTVHEVSTLLNRTSLLHVLILGQRTQVGWDGVKGLVRTFQTFRMWRSQHCQALLREKCWSVLWRIQCPSLVAL